MTAISRGERSAATHWRAPVEKRPIKLGFMIDCAPVRVHRLKDN